MGINIVRLPEAVGSVKVPEIPNRQDRYGPLLSGVLHSIHRRLQLRHRLITNQPAQYLGHLRADSGLDVDSHAAAKGQYTNQAGYDRGQDQAPAGGVRNCDEEPKHSLSLAGAHEFHIKPGCISV
jgi:hypothetical protein